MSLRRAAIPVVLFAAIGVAGYVRRTLDDLAPGHPGVFASQPGDHDH